MQDRSSEAAPQGTQAGPQGPGARGALLEPYANNGCNYHGLPRREDPSKARKARAWNPQPVFTLSPGASVALGLGDPSSEAIAVADAQTRGWWTEVANYFDFRTRTGRPRAARIRYCGRKRAALAHYAGEELYGIGHQQCKDRMCPACQVEKSREDAKLLRAYFEDRQEARADNERDRRPRDDVAGWDVDPFVFVTLTDRKEDIDTHGLVEVLDQLQDSWRAVTNAAHRKRHAQWSRFVYGGMRVIEVTHSAKGKRNQDGSVVKYTGWHPHLHVLIELRRPAPGVSWAEHRAAFEHWLRGEWYANTRGAKKGGQHFQAVDRARVGQLAKYCVKPFAVGDSSRVVARECMEGLDARRLMAGFGQWKGWRKEAQQLVKPAQGCGAVVMLATTLLDWDVRLETEVEGHTLTFVPASHSVCIVRPWATVRAAIVSDPRTIYQKIKAKTDGERDAELQEARDRIALMVATGVTLQAPLAMLPAVVAASPQGFAGPWPASAHR